jgi:hypothetical protein
VQQPDGILRTLLATLLLLALAGGVHSEPWQSVDLGDTSVGRPTPYMGKAFRGKKVAGLLPPHQGWRFAPPLTRLRP